MEPQLDNPYWDAIVGDNWPGIGPAAWNALQTVAGAGAAALDVHEFERARRGFEDRVRVSAGLRPVRAAMLAEQARLGTVREGLSLGADVFGEFAQLLRRTCHRILDIVDDAGVRVHGVRTAESDDRTDQERTAQIDDIIAGARAEVADVVERARNMVGTKDFPQLSLIAELLGRPGPWEAGGPGGSGPDQAPGLGGDRGGERVPAGASDAPDAETNHPGAKPDVAQSIPIEPREPGRLPEPGVFSPDDRPDRGGSGSGDPDRAKPGGGPDGAGPAAVGPDHAGPGGGPPDAAGPGRAQHDADRPGVGQARPESSGSGMVPIPPSPAGVGDLDLPRRSRISTAADLASDTAVLDRDSAATLASDQAGQVRAARNGTESSAPVIDSSAASVIDSPAPSVVDSSTRGAVPRTSETVPSRSGPELGEISAPNPPVASEVPPPVVAPPLGGAPITAAASPVPPSSAGPAAQSLSRSAPGLPPPVRPPGDADPRAAGRPPAVTASQGSRYDSIGPAAQSDGDRERARRLGARDPHRTGSAAADRADGDRATPDGDDPGSGTTALRDAVGAAMAAAAAPSFVLGERVDAELVLARTLLRSVLAAVDDSLVAPAWAVSIMRHSGGISAFLTSSEGRGWLPAGLYLPREISTPWVWEVARDAPWEGISDPARVLAEFGLAWGVSSGARTVALASSQPIDPGLRVGLGNLACAGEVTAAPELKLSEPAPGLVDRLGLTAAPRLLDRVAAVPERLVAQRCLALARDAHARAARVIPASAVLLGAPELRDRILTALHRHRPIPPDWWDELRDADDLLAASALPLRLDVSRIPLGELRAERSSRLNALRANYFQRRCDELLFLVGAPQDRRTLREAVYVHGQLADHPALAGNANTAENPGHRD